MNTTINLMLNEINQFPNGKYYMFYMFVVINTQTTKGISAI